MSYKAHLAIPSPLFALLSCSGALFGIRDQRIKARVAVKGFEVGVFFDTQVARRFETAINRSAQQGERLASASLAR
jgi:hypothetical protein